MRAPFERACGVKDESLVPMGGLLGQAQSQRQAWSRAFWGEMSPCEHTVQIYDEDESFLNTLEDFVCDGLDGGEGVIVIATEPHRRALNSRLAARGIDLEFAASRKHYLSLDAEETMMRFLVTGWPDDTLFESVVARLLMDARGAGRRVRAFGEMVALMWAKGMNGGTVRLEHLWHRLCRKEGFPLFCAYPRTGFTQDAHASLREICDVHSRVLQASQLPASRRVTARDRFARRTEM